MDAAKWLQPSSQVVTPPIRPKSLFYSTFYVPRSMYLYFYFQYIFYLSAIVKQTQSGGTTQSKTTVSQRHSVRLWYRSLSGGIDRVQLYNNRENK